MPMILLKALVLLSTLAAYSGSSNATGDHILVGAIRWDA